MARFLGQIFSGPKEKSRFLPAHQRQMCAQLGTHQTLTERNEEQVVQTLHEMMVLGDQNDQLILDYFLEQNILENFMNFLSQHASEDVVCK